MASREYPDSPRVGVGAVVLREGRVLLVRRGVAPANGLWAIPGGALELGETLKEGAEREILEETGITICAGDPVFTCDVLLRDDEGRIRFHYVIVDMEADYVSGEVMGGDDALEARWVAPEELPELPATKTTLKLLRQIGFTHAKASSYHLSLHQSREHHVEDLPMMSAGKRPLPPSRLVQREQEFRQSRMERIVERVSAIPKGFVRTYGDIDPGAPRLVGLVLSRTHGVPWHRVVRADGSLAKGERQRDLLLREGIRMRGARVDLRAARLPSGF